MAVTEAPKRRPPPKPKARPAAKGKRKPKPGLYPAPEGSAILGFGWGAITALALFAGSVTLGLWLGAFAALAAAQAARSRRPAKGAQASGPMVAAAALAAGLPVLGAGFGPIGLVFLGAVGVGAAMVWTVSSKGNPMTTLLCAAPPVAAACGPVILRATDGLVAALVLLSYAAAYDASAFVMGLGVRFRAVGPVCGVIAIASVTLLVAALFPQFKGADAWELGVIAAVLAPVGPIVATLVSGNRKARIPALRRLDSLLVLGPVWAIVGGLMVR